MGNLKLGGKPVKRLMYKAMLKSIERKFENCRGKYHGAKDDHVMIA